MNISDGSYGSIYSSLDHAKELGIKESDVIELTREVINECNPKYPINHQGNKEKLRRLKQLQNAQK